jgi:hypothetical protein
MTDPHILIERSIRKKDRATTGEQSGSATPSPSGKRKLTLLKAVMRGPRILTILKLGSATRYYGLRSELRAARMERVKALMKKRAHRFKDTVGVVDVVQEQDVLHEVFQRVEDLDSLITDLRSDVKVLQQEHAVPVAAELSADARAERTQARLSRFSARIVPDRSKVKPVSPETLEQYADNRTEYYLKRFGGN